MINPFGEDDDDYDINWLLDRHMAVCYFSLYLFLLVHVFPCLFVCVLVFFFVLLVAFFLMFAST